MTKHNNGQLEKRVITISAQSSILSAYKLMHENKIRHLPVLEAGKLVGILSDRDVLRASSCKKVNSFSQEMTIDKALLVEEYMSWPVFTINEATPIQKAAEILLEQKISALVVENSSGHICGIVTTDDVMKHLLDILKGAHEEKAFHPLASFLY